jgi:hypothetical protein
MRHIAWILIAAAGMAHARGADTPVAPTPHHWLFISPMGEPFRSAGKDDNPEQRWFAGADLDHDGQITPAELRKDALRFFAQLDIDKDGEITPAEIGRYENVIAPEIGVDDAGPQRRGSDESGNPSPDRHRRGERGGERGSRGKPAIASPDAEFPDVGDRQGAARYSFLSYPEPVMAADEDMNRAITRAEFLRAADQRFQLLDSARAGALTLAKLPPWEFRRTAPKRKGRKPSPPADGGNGLRISSAPDEAGSGA